MTQPIAAPTEAHVLELIARVAQTLPEAVDPGDDLYALGIDSVEALSLVAEIEEVFDCSLDENDLWDLETVGDLVAMVTGNRAGASQDSAIACAGEHDFARYVNPHLARRMSRLFMDHAFDRAQGASLYRGKEVWLDFIAQFGALPFGHNPERIWARVEKGFRERQPTMAQPSLLGPAGELARKLVELAPEGLERVTFCNSGAEAVEAAIKLAVSATGRHHIISTHNAFHGKTRGALSASGRAHYQSPFGLPDPRFERIPYGDAQALEQLLITHPERYAAFIVEPIQGEGGIIEPPSDYLRQVRDVCDRHGVLYIADEIQTGLGRTGSLFASAGSRPDIVTLSKALGGGLVPVGACLCRAEHHTEVFGRRHSSTFAGYALAMNAALATLEWLTEAEGALLEQVRDSGAYLRKQLESLRADYPDLLGPVRGRGLLLGLSLDVDPERWGNSLLGVAARQDELAALLAAWVHNVGRVRLAPTLNADSVIRIEPLLTVTRVQCDQATEALRDGLAVLDNGDTGRLFQGIRSGRDPGPKPFAVQPVFRVVQSAYRIAFLLHPLSAASYADYDPSVRRLSEQDLDSLSELAADLDPFVASSTEVTGAKGDSVAIDFIMVPHTTEQLLDMPRKKSLQLIREARDLAVQRGARLAGLGAYTSILTAAGEQLAGESLPVTSGNSFTAVAGIKNAESVLAQIGGHWSELRVAVVGATGSVGSTLTSLLLGRSRDLVLLGKPGRDPAATTARLEQTLTEALEQGDATPGRVLSWLREQHSDVSAEEQIEMALRKGRLSCGGSLEELTGADVVFVATSSPDAFLGPEYFSSGTLICDLSRPRNVCESTATQRADLLVVDGGLVSLPGRIDLGIYGLAPGEAYACMAEAIIAGLEQRPELGSTGTGTTAQARELENCATGQGIRAAVPRSFGRPVTQEKLLAFRSFWNGGEER